VVWKYRDNVDVYTKKTKAQYESMPKKTKQHVDHVTELQVGWSTILRAGTTNGVDLSKHVHVINRLLNTCENGVVTTAKVNNAKRGPFTKFCNAHFDGPLGSKTLEECYRESKANKSALGICEKTWGNIVQEVKTVPGALARKVDDIGILTRKQKNVLDLFLDEMNATIGVMDIG